MRKGSGKDNVDASPTYRDCPACSGSAATRLDSYSPAPWQVVSCDTCDFVYLRNPPDYSALVDDFAWEKTYEMKKTGGGSTRLSSTNRSLRKKLGYKSRSRSEKMLAVFQSGHVLDIGCGNGDRLLPPLIPYGIELSAELHRQSNDAMVERGGYCLHEPGAEGIWKFDEAMFDGVLMNSYLEHEVNVMKVMNGVARALKPTGRVFVRVPNFASLNRRLIGRDWCGFRYPDHVNYFTLSSLRDVAARAGFQTRLMNKFNLWVDDNIQVLLTKTTTA